MSNGIEIFDWAASTSDNIHREVRGRELRATIRSVGTKCGDCHLWMKSRACPRERNVGGRTRGPSMGEAKCEKFIETQTATEHRARLRLELSELESLSR